MNKIGFTGTRRGMTPQQEETLRRELARLCTQGAGFHHGLCVGADEQAHKIAKGMGFPIIGHPPRKKGLRMDYDPFDFSAMWPERDYLDRNKDIVNDADVLFAAPSGFQIEQRSGTWSTVHYARKKDVPVTIIYPDGSMKL